MDISGKQISPSRGLMRTCSTGAIACIGAIFLIILIQAVSGIVLAAGTRQAYPENEIIRQDAIDTFASLSSLHRKLGQAALVPAFFLTALSIVFAIYVGDFSAKHSRYPWLLTVASLILVVLFLGVIAQGNGYRLNKLDEHSYWLTPPPGGYPEGTEIATEQVVSSSTFFTFLATHGIVLPLLSVVLAIFMWPSFYEFLRQGGPESRSKWTNISEGRIT